MNTNAHSPCLDDETLAAFADGVLTGAELASAECHLADCVACRAAALELSSLVGAAADPASARAAPVGLADRILARIPTRPMERLTAAPAPEGRVLQFVKSAAAIAAVAAAAIGVAMIDGGGATASKPADPWAGLPGAPMAFPSEVAMPPRPPNLGGTQRGLGHLSTDKPVYRPGERVFGRAVILDAFERRPLLDSPYAGRTLFEVRSAKGEVVSQSVSDAKEAVAAFGWQIPPGTPGGVYTLKASFPIAGFPDAEMTFDVRDYRVPRLKTDLQFFRKAYGPGDSVVATLEATRAEGGAPSGAKVSAVARVDGKEVYRDDSATLDASGRCRVAFALPADIAVGDGTLALSIQDGGVSETAAKTIPIVVNKVALSFYPEGGDLVAGVPCRVYFEARTPKQAPADVSGRVLDGNGKQVARIDSFHEGRGRFDFVPEQGVGYRVALDKPAGIVEPIPLPEVRGAGFALATLTETVGSDEPVRISVASPTATAATVVLYQRERELTIRPIRLEAGKPVALAMLPDTAASGVLRITVHDAQGIPRAERLVFRRPAKNLTVTLAPEAATTVPGGKVRVNVLTKDEHGRPVAAVVGIAATDDAVLATIDPRERAARLPVEALLGAEVRELRDAHRYLGADPESARRTDLLLGTQGWRRFGFAGVEAFRKDHREDASRALAWRVRPVTELARGPFLSDGVYEFLDIDRLPLDVNLTTADVNPARSASRVQGWALFSGDGDNGLALTRGPVYLLPSNFTPPEALPDLVIRFSENIDPASFDIRRIRVINAAGDPTTANWNGAYDLLETGSGGGGSGGRISLLTSRFSAWAAELPWVRIYAHAAPEKKPEAGRSDFTETVYWNAGLSTDVDGRGSFEFDASDAVTTVRVRADGFAADGALGSADAIVEVRRPLYAEAKMPLEVTAGDRIDLPIAIVNGTVKPLKAGVKVTFDGSLKLTVGITQESEGVVQAGQSFRIVPSIDVGTTPGAARIRLTAVADVWTDEVARPLTVAPAGFPVAKDFGGVLEKVVEHEFAVPADVARESVVTEATVYPSPLASLTEALAALLREPCGCFEQTSSSNYPNVMALQYMKTHTGVDPALVKKALDLLQRGYDRLKSFECKEKGYEWFGGDPGHEALTAYGLMEFADMAGVMDIDREMVARTRAWLLARRDGKGGFQRNSRSIGSFGSAPDDVTNAYILWALSEAGEKDLVAEIAALKALAETSQDPYILALVANVLWKADDRPASISCLERLVKIQAKDGGVPGARTSITGSGGEALDIETTALAVLGWLKVPKRTANAEAAIRWLATRCKAGRFGSTQATILALKAIVAYDALHPRPRTPGTVTVRLDGAVVHTVAFPADLQTPITIPAFGDKIGPGAHKIRMLMDGGADMPYALTVRWNAPTPDSSAQSKVEISTAIAKADVAEGEPIEVVATIRNRADEGVPMVVAIVGLPGGVEARPDALKELVKQGKVAAFETRGREVILYWRGLAPRAAVDVTIPCLAAVPGSYTGPASRAYLYYTDEHKVWAPGLHVEIRAR